MEMGNAASTVLIKVGSGSDVTSLVHEVFSRRLAWPATLFLGETYKAYRVGQNAMHQMTPPTNHIAGLGGRNHK